MWITVNNVEIFNQDWERETCHHNIVPIKLNRALRCGIDDCFNYFYNFNMCVKFRRPKKQTFRGLKQLPFELERGLPCCLLLASLRMSITRVANSWALNRASFCLPWGWENNWKYSQMVTWLIMHWSRNWSCTDHGAGHALMTWLIMQWSRSYRVPVTWLIIHLSADWSCTDQVAIMHWTRG